MANGVPEHVWSIEQVVALARTSARFGAGEALAVPSRWTRTGVSARAVWGRYHGAGAEPYEVAVDHVAVRVRCTCPSRAQPCKHVTGLLLMWVRGSVVALSEPAPIASWVDGSRRRIASAPRATAAGSAGSDRGDPGAAVSTTDEAGLDVGRAPDAGPDAGTNNDAPGNRPDAARNERIERLMAGLVELDRWLEDRLRTGLSDPSIARFATWDDLANRLVDARAGALANRVRRLAGRVGTTSDWHERVLAEMGVLHLIAQAGQRVPALPSGLADAVAVGCGWQVRKADVEASVPATDRWLVAGRSDHREDLVEVRRVWLRGLDTGAWALVLSFAAYRQTLDTSLPVGAIVDADLHRYPGSGQRCLVGEVYDVDAGPGGAAAAAAIASTVEEACAEVGLACAAEPWLDRVAVTVRASPTIGDDGWVLTDHTGALAISPAAGTDIVAALLAASAGAPVVVTGEWTIDGVVPLAVFADGRAIDIGPRADRSFVSAA